VSSMVEEASLNRCTSGMSDRDTELWRMSSIFSMAHSPSSRSRLSVEWDDLAKCFCNDCGGNGCCWKFCKGWVTATESELPPVM
jgi:hypothetical protein